MVFLYLWVAFDKLHTKLYEFEIGIEGRLEALILYVCKAVILESHCHLGEVLNVFALLKHVRSEFRHDLLFLAKVAQEKTQHCPPSHVLPCLLQA